MCTVYYIGNHDPSIMKALGENPGVRSDSFSPSRPRLSSTISMAQTWGPQRAHELSGQGYDITMNFQCHHMSYTIIYHYHDTMYSHIPVALCFHFSLSISAKYVCMCIYIWCHNLPGRTSQSEKESWNTVVPKQPKHMMGSHLGIILHFPGMEKNQQMAIDVAPGG